MLLHITLGGRGESALSRALSDSPDLPSGARAVLDRVFWGVGCTGERVARVLPLRRRQDPHSCPGTALPGMTNLD